MSRQICLRIRFVLLQVITEAKPQGFRGVVKVLRSSNFRFRLCTTSCNRSPLGLRPITDGKFKPNLKMNLEATLVLNKKNTCNSTI
jgi:hypothetical protein